VLYEADYTVRSYEIDPTGRVLPLTLFGYMQDAAGEHSARLGISVRDLFKRNLTWVLSRYHVRIHRYPRVHSRIHLKTWPSHWEGRFALREFELTDESGALVATASSSWMLLDFATRHPLIIGDQLAPIPLLPRRVIDDHFESLPQPSGDIFELPFRVRHGDVDLNRHVNSIVYIDWALETLPPERIGRLRPASVEISYRAEAYYGDRIFSRSGFVSEMPPVSLHTLVSEETGQEVARLRMAWSGE